MADRLTEAVKPGNISILATTCSQSLNRTATALANEDTTLIQDQINDEKGRFWVWASNLGATHTATSSKSLDFRLQKSHRMRQSVIEGLERLLEISNRLYDIISRRLPNRKADYAAQESNDHDTTKSHSKETISEVDELCLGIHSTISHLFSLSILIRRQRPQGRLPNPQHFVPHEHSPDITHVRDRFPKVTRSPWLMKRLGNSITMRREALQYRQLHRKALSAGLESGDAANLWPDDISGIVATTFVESTNDREESRSDLASRPDHKSVFSSATSFMSSYNNLGESDLCIPDLSDMILDGVALQYGELFECPYCRTV
ncbi:hypothetical protein F4823DRAFT_273418 [Ustulina deusta]|nr:hypothetical protein F4823DRAFT_273418 [Ustulina deusta]